MPSSLDQILKLLFEDLWKAILRQGERSLRIQALKAGIGVIRGVRAMILINLLMTVSAFLCAISFFAAALFILEGWSTQQALTLPVFTQGRVIFSGGIFILSSLTFWLLLREKTWVEAIGLERLMQHTLEREENPSSQELADLIEKIIDDKLEKAARQRSSDPRESA